ncbi:MAG: trypsin-like peptidase domain-containing protein [Ilumatobacteraceae bacterium]
MSERTERRIVMARRAGAAMASMLVLGAVGVGCRDGVDDSASTATATATPATVTSPPPVTRPPRTTTSTTSPSTTTTSSTTTTTVPVDPAQPGVALTNAAGEHEVASGVAQLIGFGGACTAFLVALGPLDQAATAVTNGHCVGIFDATTVLVEQPVTDAALRFRLFADTNPAVFNVPVTAVAYASMRATDVAVLRLGATRQELAGLGAYALGAAPLEGSDVRIVGVPSAGLSADQWLLRESTCTTGATVRLSEFEWLWDQAIPSSCTGILGGSSGSPMFASDGHELSGTATAVGVVNTTTIGAAPGGSCSLGQPCEIGPTGVTEVANRAYAMPLAGWAACWSPEFDIASADCPAEQPPVVTVDAPRRAVQPGATWNATIANGGPDRDTLVKSGAVAGTDCRDPAGYGEPVRSTGDRRYDAAVGDIEDLYVLCAARADADGAPSTADAGYAVMQVDATPPTEPIALATNVDPSGVRVEPIFAPPEYSSFLVLAGPVGQVDCANLAAYSIYRRIPIVLDADELPAVLCVMGEDEAGNRGAPQPFPLP